MYGNEGGVEGEQRYSSATCTWIEKRKIVGYPDPKLVSTLYVEPQNRTMRMGTRRFTRLPNGFSKKVDNHAAVSLHFMNYNFARPHQTLSKRAGRKTTPAMAAGAARSPW